MSLCEGCKFAQAIEGSRMCRCANPMVMGAIAGENVDDVDDILMLTGLLYRGVFQGAAQKMDIDAKMEMARAGLFYWPVNFDPEALIKCNGREEQVISFV